MLLLLTDWVSLAVLGTTFVLAQSAVVATLAKMEFVGLRPMAG